MCCDVLWCIRLLRVPWTARRSNQTILKEISPGCSVKGLMLMLKLSTLGTWCKELIHLKRPWYWERWGQEEKGMTEGEIIGRHHQLKGHGFGWTQGVGDGQGGLACCSSWGCKESDITEQLDWTWALKIEIELVGSSGAGQSMKNWPGYSVNMIICPQSKTCPD